MLMLSFNQIKPNNKILLIEFNLNSKLYLNQTKRTTSLIYD